MASTYKISGARSNQNLFLLDGALYNNNPGLSFPRATFEQYGIDCGTS